MPAITADPARELTSYFRIGRDGALSFVYYDSNDAAFNLTGYTFVLNFKVRKDDSTNFLQLSSGSGLTISGNTIDVAITAAQAARFREQTYYWELVRTYSGLTKNWLSGDAIFHFGKFDGVEKKNSTSSSDDVTVIINDQDQLVYVTIEEFTAPRGTIINQGYWDASAGLLPSTAREGYSWIIGDGVTEGTGGGEISYLGGTIYLAPRSRITANIDNPGQNWFNWSNT